MAKCRKEYYRRYHLKRRYGIDAEEHERLLEDHRHCCAVCFSRDALCVDHDHVTGEVRGILCNGCNLGLGHFGHIPERIDRAAAYIRSPREKR